MSGSEFGAYMLLVMYYWERNCLPAEGDMPLVTRYEKKAWRKMADKVLERVRQEIPFLDKERREIEAGQARAKHGAAARWRKGEAA